MSKTFYILGALALAATVAAYFKSPELPLRGATTAARLFVMVLPNMMVGFLLGGMVQVLLPRELLAGYAGENSGFVGLLIATVAGSITPGGPFIQFPLVASLWKSGAGIGPITAYITAWALLGVQRILVWEAPIMGWNYVLIRFLATISLPFIAGYVAAFVQRHAAWM